jgi:uncharacterized protein GlcG (DUF336 family)
MDDSTGHVVMLHRFDSTQYGSIAVAEDKARSALDYRRPTKVFEDLVAGRHRLGPGCLRINPARSRLSTI